MGHLIRALTQDGAVMAMALDSTDIVARAEQIHKSSAVVTAGLGRLLTAASMLGIMLKGKDDSVTLRVQGGGPAGKLLAVSDSRGCVRGCVDHPVVELPLRADGKLDVGGAVGTDGMLYVLRDTGGKEPYVGCTPLVSGEIAEDLTAYYAQSEQTPTVCALGVLVNPDLTVRAAGGLFLQLLPYCPDSVVDQVEKAVAALPSVTAMLSDGLTPADMLRRLLDGMPFDVLDEYDPVYRCNCSRERVTRAFYSLKPEDLASLPDEEGRVEVTCRFCDKVYRFTADDLARIAADRAAREDTP